MVERPVEERRLGQHRNGRRTALFITPGNRRRIVVGREDALRRRPTLALRADVVAAGLTKRRLECFSARRSLRGSRLESGQRLTFTPHLDDAPGGGDDGSEQIGSRGAHTAASACELRTI